MTTRAQRLSDHDVQEVVMFLEYLADMHMMTNLDFHSKYQEYEGLSDAELEAIVADPSVEGR